MLAVLAREAVALFTCKMDLAWRQTEIFAFTFLMLVNWPEREDEDLLLTCSFAFCEESDDVRSFFLTTE